VKRGSSPRVVWADVIGTAGATRVRGATLKARLGLYDTWAYFPRMGGGRTAPARAAPAPRPVAGRTSGDAAPAGFRWPADTWDSRG